ncbi:MAG TPA: chromate transporter [Actinomycetota bacterium]
MNFGGPAGQIAIMHEEIVDRRKWVSNARFLHALQLLHAAAGAGGAAASDLPRMVDASRQRGASRGRHVRAAQRIHHVRPELALCGPR